MKYIAALLLLSLHGKDNVSIDNVKLLFQNAGIEDVDEEKLEKLKNAIEGKTVDELILQGN